MDMGISIAECLSIAKGGIIAECVIIGEAGIPNPSAPHEMRLTAKARRALPNFRLILFPF